MCDDEGAKTILSNDESVNASPSDVSNGGDEEKV
jgi:hypothetical protein